MPLAPPRLTKRDLEDPEVLNKVLNDIVDEQNRQSGVYGPVKVFSDIDMGGNKITNHGIAKDPGDVTVVQYIQDNNGPAAIKKQIEVTGDNIMQSVRRINDRNQRERSSSYMNDIISTPPVSNGSTIAVVAAGANSTVTVSASNLTAADGALVPYISRVDTFVNPGAGSNFYYYYFDQKLKILTFDGPYTTNTTQNGFNANLDYHAFIGLAQVNAGGGGTGGGGGGGTCVEIGVPVDYYPGSELLGQQNLPCSRWARLRFADGSSFRMAPDTLVAVFLTAREMTPIWWKPWTWFRTFRIEAGEFGAWRQDGRFSLEAESSTKVQRTTRKGTYMAGKEKVRVHNLKPFGG